LDLVEDQPAICGRETEVPPRNETAGWIGRTGIDRRAEHDEPTCRRLEERPGPGLIRADLALELVSWTSHIETAIVTLERLRQCCPFLGLRNSAEFAL